MRNCMEIQAYADARCLHNPRAMQLIAIAHKRPRLRCAAPKSAPAAPSPPAPVGAASTRPAPIRCLAANRCLSVRVYRGGTLARAGHNHIVASHDLAGTVYVAADLARSSFELQLPVASLTVDEAELRAARGSGLRRGRARQRARGHAAATCSGLRYSMLGTIRNITLRSDASIWTADLPDARMCRSVSASSCTAVTVPVSYHAECQASFWCRASCLSSRRISGSRRSRRCWGRSRCRTRCSCSSDRGARNR